jgi:aspartate/methionine/tyrosine aminotransferase
MIAWPAAPYVAWARARPAAKFDLASSDLVPVTAHDWPAMAEPTPSDDIDDDALAAAIASHCDVDPARVVPSIGSSGANFLALAALVRPGDGVLVEAPTYAPVPTAARLFGAEVTTITRRPETGYAVEPDALAAALTPRTRLIVLTRPHNPTGSIVDTRTLEAIAEIAERARVHVLVDEVYLDTLAGAGLLPAARVSDRFISTSSLTKAYGLAGVRCGWALASPGIAARMRAARAVVAPTLPPARRLAARALADLARLADRARRIIGCNRVRIERCLAGRPDIVWSTPAGGTVAFPRLLAVPDVDAFVDRLLVERQTAVVPGRFFGRPEHVRVAFGMSGAELDAGLDALTGALDAVAPVEVV